MREIKFRGKRIDNGEWVYGDLVMNRPTMSYRIFHNFANVKHGNYSDSGLHECSGELYNVMPETIGQFTGLKDKNDVDIYEGDICKVFDVLNYGFGGNYHEEQKGTIVYGGLGSFCIKICNLKIPIMHFIDNHKSIVHNTERIEVIDNIHDNPELLTQN